MKSFIFVIILIFNFSYCGYSQTHVVATDTITIQYKGGFSKLYSFIGSNFNYPQEARRANISFGRIFVKLKIKSNSEIDSIQIKRSPGFGVEEELTRVVRLTNQWIPAKVNGRNIDSFFTFDIVLCAIE